MANLCFIALEDKKVPSTSNSSYYNDDELDYDDGENKRALLWANLFWNEKNLLSKKKIY